MDPLAALRDLHLPPDPTWWPPAPGWWLLAASAVALALLARGWLPRAWRRYRVRRAALAELGALARRPDRPDLAAEVSVLLRRVAVSRDGRARVAGLCGERWLAYLDRGLPRGTREGAFTRGPGRCLASAPYGGGAPSDPRPLLDLASRWIRRNAGRAAERS